MGYRIERINRLIRQEVSELLNRQVKDPRLGSFVSVTSVTTTPDLRYAKLFISQICEEEKKEQTLLALRSAAGFLRHELGRTLRLRYIPELSFEWDDSIERGEHLLHLIDKANEASA